MKTITEADVMERGRSGSGITADHQEGLGAHDCPGETVGHEPNRAHTSIQFFVAHTKHIEGSSSPRHRDLGI